ncbi:MAG: hypothetical protein WCQ99_05910 [Pseudomonadota bacterium]
MPLPRLQGGASKKIGFYTVLKWVISYNKDNPLNLDGELKDPLSMSGSLKEYYKNGQLERETLKVSYEGAIITESASDMIKRILDETK